MSSPSGPVASPGGRPCGRRSWDAVLAVCPLLQSGLVPALLARRQKVPFIFHVQDLQLDAARELAIIRQPLLFALFGAPGTLPLHPGPGGDHHLPGHGGQNTG